MDLWKSLGGMVLVEVTSADLAAAFENMNRAEIPLYSVSRQDDLTALFSVQRTDYRKLAALAEKRGDKLVILRRMGLYWAGQRLAGRPVLLAGLLLLMMLSLMLPTRVLFVRVEGNEAVPDRRILAAAEDCGIRFGASRREVRSEKVKNALLESVPQLQWAGVNTAGCTAIISVRERPPEEESVAPSGVTNVTAIRDGVVLSVTATDGTPKCQPGQAVQAGEILISGYTDCGICIRAGQAEGEVFARTRREIAAVFPAEYGTVGEKRPLGRKISLLIGKKRINLRKDSGISEGTCGRMYSEYYITLPGGFALPMAVCVDTYHAYEIIPNRYTPQEAEETLRRFAEKYLHQQMVAGQILLTDLRFSEEEGIYLLEGDCLCTEMIGRRQQERIGETHGKNS